MPGATDALQPRLQEAAKQELEDVDSYLFFDAAGTVLASSFQVRPRRGAARAARPPPPPPRPGAREQRGRAAAPPSS
jgi:hypothetical protein